MKVVKMTQVSKDYKKKKKRADKIDKLNLDLSVLNYRFFKKFINTNYFEAKCPKCGSSLKYSILDLCKQSSDNSIYVSCELCDNSIFLSSSLFSYRMKVNIPFFKEFGYSVYDVNDLKGIYREKFDLEFNRLRKVKRINKKLKKLKK